jgi:SAM-dependent methyltransferase
MARVNPYSGDGPLRIGQRLSYLALNRIDNRRPYADRDPGVALADFQCADALPHVRGLTGTPSPSRALSDLLWMQLPWERMAQELGPLRVVDLGCGTGGYAAKFMSWSGGHVAQYTGIDLERRAEWAAAQANDGVDFRAGNIERVAGIAPTDANLIVSQSTLEHAASDEAVFAQLKVLAQSAQDPLLQIHLVPSAACLRLYLWHGYRQYTPRTLSALSRPFIGADRLIVRLGGAACNRLHWSFITRPRLIGRGDLRDRRPDEYRRALARAIESDMREPQASPAFYALLIHSNRRERLLDHPCWRAVQS